VTTFVYNVNRLARAYKGGQMLSDVAAVDYGRVRANNGKGGHGKHGTTTRALGFGPDEPFIVEMEGALARFATVWERRLEAARTGAVPRAAKGDRRSGVHQAEKAGILGSRGMSATEVAYIYGWTEDGVRRARKMAAQDPATGEPVKRDRPLTAPPVLTLARVE
jgi:hypothetical protein